MDLELKNNTQDDLMGIFYNAQLLSNLFAKGLEDNDCLLTSVVQLHQKINSVHKDIEDLVDVVIKEPTEIIKTVVPPTQTILNPLVSESIASAKEKCFNCKLQLPKISFTGDLRFSIDDLKAHLQLYTDLFKLSKINPCQAIDLFKYQCIPDILKIIALLLNAYLMITSLRRLSGLSLSMFIKGIISALLGKLLASVNISVNIGQLGIGCFIEYLENLVKLLPSTSNIIQSLTSDQIILLLENLPLDVQSVLIRQYLGNEAVGLDDPPNYSKYRISQLAVAIPKDDLPGLLKLNGFNTDYTDTIDITKAAMNTTIDSVSESINTNGVNITNKMSQGIENFNQRFLNRTVKDAGESITTAQQGIESIFKDLNDTVQNAVALFNSFIDQIQSLKAYFECELTRSGDDLLTLLRDINKIIESLNLFSSVVYALMKKEARDRCKTAKAANKITNTSKLTEDQLLLKDFLQDFYQREVDVVRTTPENVEILVYKKSVYYGLPKITLLDCSIDKFVENHKLDVIADIATKDVLQEYEDTQIAVDKGPWDSYVFDNLTDSPLFQEELKNITDILYTKPNKAVQPSTEKTTYNLAPTYNQELNNKLTNTVKCTSIEDVLNILDTIKRS
jgi:hypothetical protein